MIAALLAFAIGAQGDSLARLGTVQLPDGLTAVEVIAHDVNGDALPDLTIAAVRADKAFARELRIHLQRPSGAPFSQAPDHVLALTRDVTTYAVGDVHGRPGAEVVLFSGRGAFAWLPGAPEDARYAKLAASDFLWQMAEPDDLGRWQIGVRDIDGDGLDDLLLPEPGGYRIVRQRRAAGGEASFPEASLLTVPEDFALVDPEDEEAQQEENLHHGERFGRQGDNIQITFGLRGASVDDGGPRYGSLLDLRERVPTPILADWDGNGTLDLLAQTRRHLLVWKQANGAFSAEPQVTAKLPVEEDFERELDVSHATRVCDLDGDGRADLLIFASDKNSDDARTQVLVYVQARANGRPPFGDEGLPSQLLVLAGIAGVRGIADVDGDGTADLICTSLRPDRIDQLSSAGSDRIEGELYVYTNRGGTLSSRPELSTRLAMDPESFRVSARFLGDVSGDGVSEVLTREDPERLKLLLVRKSRKGLQVVGQPLWELAVDEDADLSFVERSGGAGLPEDLIVVEDDLVRYVRFRP